MASSSSNNVVQKYKNKALMVATRSFGIYIHGVYFCEKPGYCKIYAIEEFGKNGDYVAIERRSVDPNTTIPDDVKMAHIFRLGDFEEEVSMEAYCHEFTEDNVLFLSASDDRRGDDHVFVNLAKRRIVDAQGHAVHPTSSVLVNKTLDNCYVIDQKQLHMRTVNVAEALTPAFKDFYYVCQGFMAPEDMTEFEGI